MKIIDLLSMKVLQKVPMAECVCAFGGFDGVHLGHAALLRRTVRLAAESGGALIPAVWTLEHKNGADFPCLTELSEKLRIFASLGLRVAFIEDFDEIKNVGAADFVRDTVRTALNCRVAVCGYNFRFGRGAAAGGDELRTLMRDFGGDAEVVPGVELDGSCISASAVRSALCDADIVRANRLLGRRYSLQGTVLHGREIGRTLGFPTANMIFPASRVIPARGVYVTASVICDGPGPCGGRADEDLFFPDGEPLRGGMYASVTNIGTNPTVAEEGAERQTFRCETHLIGCGGDLYGKTLRVYFCDYLRPERKFSSREELAQTVVKNIGDSKRYFGMP